MSTTSGVNIEFSKARPDRTQKNPIAATAKTGTTAASIEVIIRNNPKWGRVSVALSSCVDCQHAN
jgi:hypothetical protein